MKNYRLRPRYLYAFTLLIIFVIGSVAAAQQFDAPYYELQKKHADEWAKEDKAIDAKLAAL